MDMPKRDLYHIAAKEAHNELTDNLIYTKLSEIEKERSLVTLFSNLAKMEDGHYRFWKQYCSGAVIYPNNAKIYFILRSAAFWAPPLSSSTSRVGRRTQ